jgi:hypothetical protein
MDFNGFYGIFQYDTSPSHLLSGASDFEEVFTQLKEMPGVPYLGVAEYGSKYKTALD